MSKIFETIFNINGKLNASFNQAFGKAQKQIANTGKVAEKTNKHLVDLSKASDNAAKSMAGLVKSGIALGAAYLGLKSITGILDNAVKSSNENAAANFKLLNTL